MTLYLKYSSNTQIEIEGQPKNWPFFIDYKVSGQFQMSNLVNPEYPDHFCTPLEFEDYQTIL